MYGIRENLYNDIINTLKNFGVIKVIIFGSRAREDYKVNPDIDLTVIFKNEMEKDGIVIYEG